MKKLLLTVVLFAFAMVGFAQTTYYWVGGVGPTSFTSNSNWNTALNGSGLARVASATTDILIFDGTNVGGSTPATGSIVATTSSTSFRQLILVNNANVAIERNAVGGTATLTVTGDGTATDDVQVPLGSYLTIKSQTGDATGTVNMTLASGAATARIFGTFDIKGGGCRLTSATASSVFFEDGSLCNVNTELNSQYPFTSANSNAVIFKSGSRLKFLGGQSFFSNSSGNTPLIFQTGSTCEFAGPVPYINPVPSTSGSSASNFFNGRTYAKVIISGNATVASDAFSRIDDLTINAGSTFNLKSTGSSPIFGDILNNGTLGVDGGASGVSSQLLMVKNGEQSISGLGTFSLANIAVATDANVTLSRSLSINGSSTSSVLGILNLGANSISGAGNFQFRPAAILSDPNASTSSTLNTNVITMTDAIAYDNLSPTIGLKVTGAGIPANSYIIATNSGAFQFTISNSATATASGVLVTTTGGAATLSTSNTGGPDASVGTSGTKNFGTGTNLIIKAATSAPFPTFSTNDIGNLTINANVTTNRSATVTGNVTLSSAKLTVAEGNELTVAPTTTFTGASTTAYIVTAANSGSGAIGKVNIAGLAASKMFPVGSATNYLPVTLNPATSSDFSINVFQGATTNATPNGTALTASQKLDIVDAIWNVNRTTGTGNCTVSLAWTDALEGSGFSSAMAGLGVAQYTTSYSAFTGTASSTTNTASITTTNDAIGAFLVGKTTTLPVKLISFTAKAQNNTAVLNWKTTSEIDLSNYLVQRSNDGQTFATLTTVKANNAAGTFDYTFTDNAPAFGANYYQLVSVDTDGKTSTSSLQSVNFGATTSLTVYPNPTKGAVKIAGLVKGDVVKVTDLLGRTINSQNYNGEGAMNLSLDAANSGVYLITISNNGIVTSTQRVVKN